MNFSEILELRINCRSVRLYPKALETITDGAVAVAAMTPGPISPLASTPSICLLSGPLEEFVQYSRQEASKWLIDLAHDICDPAQQRGSLLVWKEPQHEWSLVAPTDPLTVSIYRYDLPDGTTVGLSKISRRLGRSRTTVDESASDMRHRVMKRDGACWVTAFVQPVVNSHICPKRMGDHTARYIYKTCTSALPLPGLSIYNEIFGFCLSINLDVYFHAYELGFRVASADNYECHVFAAPHANHVYTIYGCGPTPIANTLPPLHGYHISPPRPQSGSIPPAGLFRWHYLQCVIKKFAHDDYRRLENIEFYELPLRMKGDSDDEGTDSEFEWPSKALDLGRVVGNDSRECEECNEAVATWIESTCTSQIR